MSASHEFGRLVGARARLRRYAGTVTARARQRRIRFLPALLGGGILLLLLTITGGAAANGSLIGYWPLDGTGADLSGGGRDFDLAGGVGFAPGLFGQALGLANNGSQYAARSVDDAVFDFGANDFTLQLWVNFNNTSREQTLLEKFSSQAGPGWTLTKLDGNALHFYAAPAIILYSNALSIPSGVWHHILMRRAGTDFQLFYDGNVVAAGSSSGALPDTNMPLLVGKRNDNDGRNFAVDGRIDDVAIWSTALTDAEIAVLFNDGNGNPVPNSIPDSDGDGVPDATDPFPTSNTAATVVIATCDSGVTNHLFANGSTMSDLIGQCAAGATEHGGFVSCVTALTTDWKKAGLLTGAQKGAIVSCAAGAPIP